MSNSFPSSQTVNRVLCIPELLDMICSYLDYASNANNALVCKAWGKIALDALWKEVDDLPRLLSLLAPMKQGLGRALEFENLPQPEDWKRFDPYAKRVRRLTHGREATLLKISVYEGIAMTRTRLEILPNLHTLQWFGPLAFSVLFMHAGVKRFATNLQEPEEGSKLDTFFQDVQYRMPNLVILDISTTIPARTIEKNIITLVSNLPKLQTITFPRFYFTNKIAEALSRLDNLGTIEFQYSAEQGCGDAADVADFSPALSAGAFPALWDHSMNVSFENASRFLSSPFSPSNLKMLYIDSEFIETPELIHNLLCIVAENCQLLEFLALVTLRDPSIPTDSEEWRTSYSITLDTIKPVLKLPNLSSLEIVHQYPLSLRQEDIEHLAPHWPNLQALLLNNEPVYLKESPLTFDALLPFARHCPKLTHLGIFIDADAPGHSLNPQSADFSTAKAVRFAALQRLSMGVSVISEEENAALCLSQILPLGCALDCGITWDDVRGEQGHVGDVGEVVRERCEVWTAVGDVLGMLIRLRMQERARVHVVERELEDLRMRTGVIRDLAGMEKRERTGKRVWA